MTCWPPTGECSMCGDTGLMLGGWMGPTKDAPWPRACISCDCGRLMTPRMVQLRVIDLIERDLRSGREPGERGYFAESYAGILTLDGLYEICGLSHSHDEVAWRRCERPKGHGGHHLHRHREDPGRLMEIPRGMA